MKAKYQKYYDALKGADLSSGVSTLSGAVSKSTTELAAIKSNSTAWNELGAQAFNDVTLSQTALFSIPGASLGSYKGMVRVKVKVVE